jgi:hypothetical protein
MSAATNCSRLNGALGRVQLVAGRGRVGKAVCAGELPVQIVEAVILQINHDDVLEAVQTGDIPRAADRLAGCRD